MQKDEEKKRDLKDLAKDIIASYEARVKIVGGIVEDTYQMMDNFKGKREQMSKELQEVLAKCESLRKKDFAQMMAEIVTKQNERERQVKKMLEDFRGEEESVAARLRNLLQKGEKIRLKDFKKMMREIKQDQEERVKKTSLAVGEEVERMRKEVHIMLDNFKTERRSVANAWHEILNLFHKEGGDKK